MKVGIHAWGSEGDIEAQAPPESNERLLFVSRTPHAQVLVGL